MNPDQQIELYRHARSTAWAYKLEQYDAAALKDMQRIVEKSKGSIVQKFGEGLGQEGAYTRQHFQNNLKELERLSLGLRNQLGEQLTTSTSRIGSLALKEWGENLSVGGVAKKVNTVALSPEQFKAFFTRNPPAGLLIPKVMRNALNQGVQGRIQGELLDVLKEGALTGQSYKRIVDKLSESFTDFSRHQLSTLTRLFFQTANAQAFDAVYQANQDIMEGKIWTNSNDDRVCLLCLPLGEVLFRKGEDHPPMPRHPNCRCVFRAKTVSYRSLGVDVDELEEVAAPVVTRGYEKNGKWIIPPAGTGSGRGPRKVSFYKGGMKEAFPDLPAAQQKAMLGVGRYNLYKAGDLTLDQLVEPRTGKLWLLKEIEQGMHLRVPDVPVRISDPMDLRQYKPTSLKTSDIEFGRISSNKADELIAISRSSDLDSPSDEMMRKMNELTGADAKPTVVSSEIFDRLEKQSDNIAFRSVGAYGELSPEDMMKQFREGGFFAGRGIYGNGTYASGIDKSTFKEFAPSLPADVKEKIKQLKKQMGAAFSAGNDSLAEDLVFEIHGLQRAIEGAKDVRITKSLSTVSNYGSHTMRMMLKPGAKIIKEPDVADVFAKKYGFNSAEALEAVKKTNPEYKKLLGNIYYDKGRMALSMGYDVIEVQYSSGEKFYVYLNRGALIVDQADYTPQKLVELYKSRDKEW